ncbi:uncharacterized protein [Nicotiana sylvestris]|uniref:uncharacterized protein n=1 Tax=Nicotiana sylvestris TaxID=4096 RepID=UPI00388C71A1
MDPLKYIFQKTMPMGKLAKWQILLSRFDIIYVTQKAVKGKALANHLAENPAGGEYEPLKISPCTNNMAEYEACILGLNMVVDMNIQELLTICDSDFLMHQVKAASYKVVTKKVIADFVKDRIVCRFGVLESIVTDNAANLNSDLMKAMCETFKIKLKNSTTYKPQLNGAVEAANKNIKKILRKMVENHKQWHEKLPFALLGYRTTVRTSTGATPYMLVYDGKRMNAVCHGQLYQNKMSKAFNKRVKPRQFSPGQLVLKKIFPHQDEAKRKFSPNWQGPYMVHRVLIGGALILAEMNGEIWQKPINSDAVKRYYA